MSPTKARTTTPHTITTTTTPKVVIWNARDRQAATRKGFYVGRPTRWGNPFTVDEYGRDAAVEAYRQWLADPDQYLLRAAIRRELRGKDLICWCAPKACHAEVLAEVANS